MIGVRAFVCAQRVDVRRMKPGHGGAKPTESWESGAEFSHYRANGVPVVKWPDGRYEPFEDGTWLREAGTK